MLNLKGKNLIILVLSILSLVLAAGLVYSQASGRMLFEKKVSPKKAADLVISHLNENILRGSVKAELSGEVKERKGLYNFKVKIGPQQLNSYATKDGKLFFPQAILIKGKNGKIGCEGIEKKKSPKLEAFVVSYCPFGAQMERILSEVVKNIPELSENIRIKYIGAVREGKIVSMHGDKEAEENLRQICLREEQKDKFYPYLSCFLKSGDSEECINRQGIDEEKLSLCIKDDKRGLAYAEKDFSAQESYGIAGSPTLILNGEKVSEFDFGGRTAEAVKTLICCGFNKAPKFCRKELSKKEAATGFSVSYSAEESAGGASCGE